MKNENPPPGQFMDDPLSDVQVGAMITYSNLEFPNGVMVNSNNEELVNLATDTPQSISNWWIFDGAVLAVILADGIDRTFLGSAFVVSPGLAFTAMHCLDNHCNGFASGDLAIFCVGIRQRNTELWEVRAINSAPESDIAILSVIARSELSEKTPFRKFALTTRKPKIGEKITTIGFRPNQSSVEQIGTRSWKMDANLFLSSGIVTNANIHGRDRVLMPAPYIEAQCQTLGGMSGGAVLDVNGRIIGLVTRGMDPENESSYTVISWIIGVFTRKVSIVWPPGAMPEEVSILSLNSRMLSIDNRNSLAGTTSNWLQYKEWS